MKRFNTASARMNRLNLSRANAKPLVMRPPIEPSVSAVQTPEDHPLWQFFSNKQFMRTASSLEDLGRPWSIPQLRRKNFEDLHTLWYVSLRELNKVNREMRLLALYENRPSEDTRRYEKDENRFTEVAEDIKTTMWRIRHVLAERYHSWKEADLLLKPLAKSGYWKYTDVFESEYLSADSNADAQVNAQLERLQYVLFGINPFLENNIPEPSVAQGLHFVAGLKLQRYGGEERAIKDVRDIREAYTLFSCEASPEGVASAIDTITEVRERGEPVPRSQEIEVLAELMHAAQL